MRHVKIFYSSVSDRLIQEIVKKKLKNTQSDLKNPDLIILCHFDIVFTASQPGGLMIHFSALMKSIVFSEWSGCLRVYKHLKSISYI